MREFVWKGREVEYKHEYYLKHKKEISERVRKWRQENRLAHNAYVREYWAKNREKLRAFKREAQKRFKKKNPEKVKESNKKWANTGKGKHLKIRARARRRARLKNIQLIGSHTLKEWRNILVESGGICMLCYQNVGIENLTKDHIIPVTVEGSSDSIENIQPACQSCNSRKGTKVSLNA